MRKLFSFLAAILFAGSMMAATVADLAAITSNYTYTPTAALTENTLYDNNRILSLGGSGYSVKNEVTVDSKKYTPCVQIKNNRQIAMKIACDANITIIGNSNSARAWQIGTSSAGKEIADGGNGSTTASGRVIGTSTEPVIIYINATSDLYLAAIIITENGSADQVKTPSIKGEWGESYNDPTTVTITCGTDDASIYYTTNGDDPTTSSALYTQAFTVTSNCTVKAFAVKDGLNNSNIASENITINNLHKINYDFSGVTLTSGVALAKTTEAHDTHYHLPSGRLYYVSGKTQTAWSDGEKEYELGENITIDKDYTFTPVFEDNNITLGAEEVTVNWTFATSEGAPSGGIEGKEGDYAQHAIFTSAEKVLDVIMHINAKQDAGILGAKGKWNTTSADNRAQVNKGTVFTIPAITGMVVTITITNGTAAEDMFTFNGEQGTANTTEKTVSYTYNGTDSSIDIIDQGKNTYPAGISVVYPEVSNDPNAAATGADAWENMTTDNTKSMYKDGEYLVTKTPVGKHGTICLPYNATVTGAVIYAETANRVEGGLEFDYAEGDAENSIHVEAGHAYIYFATADVQTWTRTDSEDAVNVVTTGNLLVGTYSQITLAYNVYFFYTADEYFHPAGDNVVLPAFRACIPNIDATGAPIRLIMPKTGVATGVENAADYKATKAMVDGKIVILRGAKSYNVAGQVL